MPNNKYLRSRRREQELVRFYKGLKYISARSAGSKSPVDVWAFKPSKKVVFLDQIKTKKGGKNEHIKLIRKTTGVTVYEYLVEYK